MLLDAICSAKDRENILMVATDGVFSREKLTLPKPRDTGTFDVVDEHGKKTGKALGSWELAENKDGSNPLGNGIFLVRPGIYFFLKPSDQSLKGIKSRGIAKRMLLENTERIQESWKRYKWHKDIIIPGTRFVGAKSAISKAPDGTITRGENYGEWCPWPMTLGFQPEPKRQAIVGRGRLVAWEMAIGESTAYDRAVVSQSAQVLRETAEIIEEQPDAGSW